MEINYLLLLPITVVCAWMLVFLQSHRVTALHDRMFLTFSLCCAITYFITIHALIEGTNSYHFIWLDNIETVVGLSICPLLFIYMRLVAIESHWRTWYWWLLVPAAVIGVAGSMLSLAVGWDRIIEIRSGVYNPFVPDPHRFIEILYYWVNIRLFNLVLELMAVGMISMCVYYLYHYMKHAENYYDNIKNTSMKEMQCFLICSILNLLILFGLTFFIHSITGSNQYSLLLVSFFVSILLCFMAKNAFEIVAVEEHLEIINTLGFPDKENMEPGYDQKIEALLHQWQNRAGKSYCREGITLSDIAKEIEISPRSLSAYINKTREMNFRRWINLLRIEEAKRLMAENPADKLSYIATLCGFADISSFSKAFRLQEGCSPIEYKRSLGEIKYDRAPS